MRERWPAVMVSGCLGLLAAVMMLGANESWSAPQAARIGPRAVFSPKRDLETKVIEEMQSCPVAVDAGAPKIECVTSILRQAGATPEALAFTAMLGGEGYLESFRQMGKVDLATVAYPLRANENEGFMLVNGSPPTVQVEDFVHLKHIDIRKDPLYPAIARKFPRVELWGHADFKAVQALPGGGQRFIFSFVLLNGCHACEVAGYAQVAFDFSAAGRFLGTKLLRLTEKGNSLSSTANVQVLTPRLTKSFTPTGQGNQATMTLTLTNVGGNPLEQGITFTDTLSPGLQIVGTPSTTCHVGTVTVAGNALTFQGQMQAGEATCTVTVRVDGAGCNDRSNISHTANIDPSGVNAMLNVKECPLSLTVQKAVTGAPPGFTGTFHFTVVCTTSNGVIQQPLTIIWPSTTATLPGIPPGSTCFVSEDPTLPPLPTGSSWSGVPISNPPGGVIVLSAGGKNQVSFTNAVRTCNDSAHLKITKVLQGVPQGFSGTFNFNVACWSGTNLMTRQVKITLPGSATVTVPGLLPGAACTVSEVSPEPALPTGWFWQAPSYLPASGQVNLVGNCCPEVVVTDTAKFCCDSEVPVVYPDRPSEPSHSVPRAAVPPS